MSEGIESQNKEAGTELVPGFVVETTGERVGKLLANLYDEYKGNEPFADEADSAQRLKKYSAEISGLMVSEGTLLNKYLSPYMEQNISDEKMQELRSSNKSEWRRMLAVQAIRRFEQGDFS
jgi:hypothetical protein